MLKGDGYARVMIGRCVCRLPSFCSYLSREELERRGLSKLVQQADARMAALAAGTDNRPVTTREIQGHLEDFALAKEFSVYGKIGGLSGGQKVSAVIEEHPNRQGRRGRRGKLV